MVMNFTVKFKLNYLTIYLIFSYLCNQTITFTELTMRDSRQSLFESNEQICQLTVNLTKYVRLQKSFSFLMRFFSSGCYKSVLNILLANSVMNNK